MGQGEYWIFPKKELSSYTRIDDYTILVIQRTTSPDRNRRTGVSGKRFSGKMKEISGMHEVIKHWKIKKHEEFYKKSIRQKERN